ncbi:MAG TPA: LysR substrate-binding domain-containing protein [Rubrivivax sp.]|nr:LysR substrate-binding domain-containing protein [Rubrivivax sp.]HRZ62208.1 LysR substrate-binding domain-containing protein [Rubrivivax sp.]
MSGSPAAESALGEVLYARLAAHARLRHLQLLAAIDACGSIARAAAQLHISQPAATQSLTDLERIVGVRLFDRHARGVRANAAGRALTAAARGALGGMRTAAESLAAITHGATAALALGTIPAAAQALVADLLAAFCAAHPGVHVELHEDSGQRLLPMLGAGTLDAVFCRAPDPLPAGCRFEPLLDDGVVVVAGSHHPLAQRRGLRLEDLQAARWVLPVARTQLREVFEALVLARQPDARWFPVATTSLPVLQGLLQQPGAASLMPRSLSAAMCASGRVCRLDLALDAPLRPLGVAYDAADAPALMQGLLAVARRGRPAAPGFSGA